MKNPIKDRHMKKSVSLSPVAESGEFDRLPGLHHALLPRPLHLDPRAAVAHEVRAHRRLELVLRAHLPGLALHETRVHALQIGRAGNLKESKLVLRLQDVENITRN